MSKFLTTPRTLEKVSFLGTLFPGNERGTIIGRRERVRSHGIELMRITRIERFPDDRSCSLQLCRNEFHDGDRRNIKKWLEKRWKKREKERGERERISCHRLSGNEFFISRKSRETVRDLKAKIKGRGAELSFLSLCLSCSFAVFSRRGVRGKRRGRCPAIIFHCLRAP